MWLETSLRRLAKTSGFRLAWRSLALSLIGAVIVFGVIHHAIETGWRDDIDGAVASALSDIESDMRDNGQSLAQNVRDTLAENGGLFYADIAPDGALRAGNLRPRGTAIAGWRGFKTLREGDGFILPRRVSALRGIVQTVPGGDRLVIAADASALLALNSLIARSFLAVFGTILALGLLGGSLAARAALRRVDDFAGTIEDIMKGDLSRRLAVSRANDEFDRLAVSTNALLQRMQELMENLRQVTNDISHDLRSPLARLREHLELAKGRFGAPEAEAMLDEALSQVDQALEIFAAMLQIAEIEAGARRARFAPVSLASLLRMIGESYEPSFAANGIAIQMRIDEPLTVQGDKDLLAQLVTNLLDNTLLHARGATLVTLGARRVENRVEMALCDNGGGIPADQLQRVTQRFVRLDTARHLPGHGLGLPLCLAIAAMHDGQISLRDNSPGLCVQIVLPASRHPATGQ